MVSEEIQYKIFRFYRSIIAFIAATKEKYMTTFLYYNISTSKV